jgi:hypothetical protein
MSNTSVYNGTFILHAFSAGPGSPGQPTIQFLQSTSARVSWSPPTEPNGEIVGYFLDYSFANDSSTVRRIALKGDENFHDVKNLKHGIMYKFRVKAETTAGPGDFSQATLFRMKFRGKFSSILLFNIFVRKI